MVLQTNHDDRHSALIVLRGHWGNRALKNIRRLHRSPPAAPVQPTERGAKQTTKRTQTLVPAGRTSGKLLLSRDQVNCLLVERGARGIPGAVPLNLLLQPGVTGCVHTCSFLTETLLAKP